MAVKTKSSATVRFKTTILKFRKKGEKSGWTYIDVPADVATQLFPGNKKSFRVKGFLDQHPVNGVALLPMGEGSFLMPLNATIRKKIGKNEGAMLFLELQLDTKEPVLNKDLLTCLEDEPEALSFFKSLTKSHQNYFSKWVDGARTAETKAKRIARIINALTRKMDYGQMLRERI